MRVEIKALAKRLTKTASSALERAVKDAAEEGHAEVTIAHVVLQIVSVKDEDAEALLAAIGSSRAEARKAALVALSELKSGGGGRPAFAPSLWPWIEGGWLLAATELAEHRARSGALLWAAARHAKALDHEAGALAPLADLDAAKVSAALEKSPESSEAFGLGELEAWGRSIREQLVARGRDPDEVTFAFGISFGEPDPEREQARSHASRGEAKPAQALRDPQEIIDRIAAYQQIGFSHLGLSFGWSTLADYRRELDFFATRVMPAFA